MRHRLAAIPIALMIATIAHAESGGFLGVYTTPTLPWPGCTILPPAVIVGRGTKGYGVMGGDKGYGFLNDIADFGLNGFEGLETDAKKLGYNAVIGAQVVVSHTADAVYENGNNWSRGTTSYDKDGSYIVMWYGTAIRAECP